MRACGPPARASASSASVSSTAPSSWPTPRVRTSSASRRRMPSTRRSRLRPPSCTASLPLGQPASQHAGDDGHQHQRPGPQPTRLEPAVERPTPHQQPGAERESVLDHPGAAAARPASASAPASLQPVGEAGAGGGQRPALRRPPAQLCAAQHLGHRGRGRRRATARRSQQALQPFGRRAARRSRPAPGRLTSAGGQPVDTSRRAPARAAPDRRAPARAQHRQESPPPRRAAAGHRQQRPPRRWRGQAGDRQGAHVHRTAVADRPARRRRAASAPPRRRGPDRGRDPRADPGTGRRQAAPGRAPPGLQGVAQTFRAATAGWRRRWSSRGPGSAVRSSCTAPLADHQVAPVPVREARAHPAVGLQQRPVARIGPQRERGRGAVLDDPAVLRPPARDRNPACPAMSWVMNSRWPPASARAPGPAAPGGAGVSSPRKASSRTTSRARAAHHAAARSAPAAPRRPTAARRPRPAGSAARSAAGPAPRPDRPPPPPLPPARSPVGRRRSAGSPAASGSTGRPPVRPTPSAGAARASASPASGSPSTSTRPAAGSCQPEQQPGQAALAARPRAADDRHVRRRPACAARRPPGCRWPATRTTTPVHPDVHARAPAGAGRAPRRRRRLRLGRAQRLDQAQGDVAVLRVLLDEKADLLPQRRHGQRPVDQQQRPARARAR